MPQFIKLTDEEIRELLAWDAKSPAEKRQETRVKQHDADETLAHVRRDRDEARRKLEEIADRWETLKRAYLELDAVRHDALALLDADHPAARRLSELS